MKRLLLLWLIASISQQALAQTARKDIPLKKGMPLLAARKVLFENGWKPRQVDIVEPMGIERKARKAGISEIEHCAMSQYQQYCFFNYQKRDECLWISTVGEQIKDMTVFGWKAECPSAALQHKDDGDTEHP